ncbi:MAG: NADH-quinone oxidoreductase subunit NuoE [Dehalococcoidia bacterium]|nr:MAG: NADH-quinone oxidoreductase subunit NuoE [Dehalococcoidia bacterium]
MEVDFAKESEKITANYSRDSGNLIPILQEAQEKFGYLPAEAMQKIAKFLKLPESTIFGVSTFYAQFKLTPTGRTKIVVCRGTACHVRGGARILREIERRLGIKPGETTEDMEYSLETIACIGACALAPTMRIDNETYGQMTTKKVAEVVGVEAKAS